MCAKKYIIEVEENQIEELENKYQLIPLESDGTDGEIKNMCDELRKLKEQIDLVNSMISQCHNSTHKTSFKNQFFEHMIENSEELTQKEKIKLNDDYREFRIQRRKLKENEFVTKRMTDNLKKNILNTKNALNTFNIEESEKEIQNKIVGGKKKYNYKLYAKVLKFCKDNPEIDFEVALKQLNGGE